MNLDGYNKSAKAQEIVQGLKVQPKSNGLSSTASSEAESSKGIGVVGIVVIVVVAAVIVGAVIFVIKKKRSQFWAKLLSFCNLISFFSCFPFAGQSYGCSAFFCDFTLFYK